MRVRPPPPATRTEKKKMFGLTPSLHAAAKPPNLRRTSETNAGINVVRAKKQRNMDSEGRKRRQRECGGEGQSQIPPLAGVGVPKVYSRYHVTGWKFRHLTIAGDLLRSKTNLTASTSCLADTGMSPGGAGYVRTYVIVVRGLTARG